MTESDSPATSDPVADDPPRRLGEHASSQPGNGQGATTPAATEPEVVPLPRLASSAKPGTGTEFTYRAWDATMIRNVVTPSLTVFLPDPAVATGAGVVIAPGGGFCWLTWDVEGTMLAEWLRNRGVAAFVLKYRTVDMGETEAEFEQRSHEVVEAMLNLARVDEPWNVRPVRYPWLDAVVTLAEEDAGNAVRHVREKAVPYRVAADRIGFLGFSAGGILALGLALRHDGRSRPDFIVPVYGISHDPLVVPVDAPPMFLVCAVDDDVVAPHASAICDAWRAAGKSVESHVYSCGGHGFGMRAQGLPVDSWAERFHDWLDVEGFLTPDTQEKG